MTLSHRLDCLLQVFTWGSNSNGCLGRPTELENLEEGFCAVPGQVEGMDAFVGRPCSSASLTIAESLLLLSRSLALAWLTLSCALSYWLRRSLDLLVACGKEFTLIATKPYIGPSREELERRSEVHAAQAQSIKRQAKNVKGEQQEQLEQIRRSKVAVLVQFLNGAFPKCVLCTIGTTCPGFQRDAINPAMCRHCMHERRKHDVLHSTADKRGGTKRHLAYLLQVAAKLDVVVDMTSVADIALEEALEDELEDYVDAI